MSWPPNTDMSQSLEAIRLLEGPSFSSSLSQTTTPQHHHWSYPFSHSLVAVITFVQSPSADLSAIFISNLRCIESWARGSRFVDSSLLAILRSWTSCGFSWDSRQLSALNWAYIPWLILHHSLVIVPRTIQIVSCRVFPNDCTSPTILRICPYRPILWIDRILTYPKYFSLFHQPAATREFSTVIWTF